MVFARRDSIAGWPSIDAERGERATAWSGRLLPAHGLARGRRQALACGREAAIVEIGAWLVMRMSPGLLMIFGRLVQT